jgi:hypothetical protein
MQTESDLLALARFCLQQAAKARDARTADALRRLAQEYEGRADQLRTGGSQRNSAEDEADGSGLTSGVSATDASGGAGNGSSLLRSWNVCVRSGNLPGRR